MSAEPPANPAATSSTPHYNTTAADAAYNAAINAGLSPQVAAASGAQAGSSLTTNRNTPSSFPPTQDVAQLLGTIVKQTLGSQTGAAGGDHNLEKFATLVEANMANFIKEGKLTPQQVSQVSLPVVILTIMTHGNVPTAANVCGQTW